MKKIVGILLILCLCCLSWAAASVIAETEEHRDFQNNSFSLLQTKKETRIRVVEYFIEQPNRPDYYSTRSIDPWPYIDNTSPEKRNIWFVFSANKKNWRINWDAERKPLKYIIIHSTPDKTPKELDEYYKNALYAGRYQSEDNDPYVKGLEPHSGHIIDGRESFSVHHWIIYPDGKVVKGLDSTLIRTKDGLCPYHVAWHAGNWQVNCESFSMLFIMDDPEGTPTEAQIKTANCIIDNVRDVVPSVSVAPHYQFWSQTNCPGWSFQEWGKQLH